MEIKFVITDRGFVYGTFKDRDGDECRLLESSIMGDPCIRFGMAHGTHHLGKCLATMHLNQEQVRELLPLLAHFVETGNLPRPNTGDVGASPNRADHTPSGDQSTKGDQ